MKICVLGLGYVGAVSAALLAKEGHEVIGVDPERAKVDLINAGRSPIIEKDLNDIIAAEVAAGRLRASTKVEDAVRHTDLALVCVGTPSQPNGGIDLRYVRRVCEQIGEALKDHPGHTVVVRSTMPRPPDQPTNGCSYVEASQPEEGHQALRATRMDPHGRREPPGQDDQAGSATAHHLASRQGRRLQ